MYVILTWTKQIGLDYDCHFEHSGKGLRITVPILSLVLVVCRPNSIKNRNSWRKRSTDDILKGRSKAKQCRKTKVLGSAIFAHTGYHSKVCSRPFKNDKHSQPKRRLLALTQYAFWVEMIISYILYLALVYSLILRHTAHFSNAKWFHWEQWQEQHIWKLGHN